MAGLIRYNDPECEYALFVSFAHMDNRVEDGWVAALKMALFQRLGNLGEIPQKEIYFSDEQALVAGTLGHQLRQRVARSFAMLLVVGPHYVESDWCEQELEFFQQHFPGGAESRLYIAVMSEAALKKVQEGAAWKATVHSDSVWTPMYRETSRNRPLEHRLPTGDFHPTFRNAAFGLADKLVEEIRADWSASAADLRSEAAKSDRLVLPVGAASGSAAPRMRVAIAPYTPTFEASGKWQPIASLQQSLQNAGAEVRILSSTVLASYDPSDGSPLRDALRNADVLVGPILDEKPMRSDLVGGHTSILVQEWEALKKPTKDLVWYRPESPDRPAVPPAPEKHRAWLGALAPVCISPQAVVNLLFGAGTSDVIRVYIEENPFVPIWGLSYVLEEAWKALQKSGEQRPKLKCVPLRLNRMDDVPKDVAAVVLLDAKGYTPKQSLRARQSEIEKLFPKSTPAYPGLVALVFTPPPPDNKPDHDWGDVTFYRSEVDNELKLDDDSRIWLNDFLNQMWRHHPH